MSETEEFRQAVGGFLRVIAGLKGHLRWLVWATLGAVAVGILGALLFRLLAR